MRSYRSVVATINAQLVREASSGQSPTYRTCSDDDVLALASKILAQRLRCGRQYDALNSPAAVRDYLRIHLAGLEHEEFHALFLDVQNRLICHRALFRGTLTQTSVHPREVVKAALEVNGAAVIFAQQTLVGQSAPLTNSDLEDTPVLHTLVDGIDATLIDLAAEEIGEDALVEEAVRLADQTFASQQADPASKQLLQRVFELRARRVVGIRTAGRLEWIRETGAHPRMLHSVESGLLTRRATWDDVTEPLDASVVGTMLEWAWGQADVQEALREAHRLEDNADASELKQPFFGTVSAWLSGARFKDIAPVSGLDLDELLGLHGRVVSYVLQTVIEQGVALLAKLLEGQGRLLAPAVIAFPEHLRFGVPTVGARVLAGGGVRHRSAAVELGDALRTAGDDRSTLMAAALRGLRGNAADWERRLGALVYKNTLLDLSSAIGDKSEEEVE